MSYILVIFNVLYIICSICLILTGDESMRYAISADVDVVEGSYIQFYLSMGCNQTSACYSEYTHSIL